jgi:hypothetical protein
MNPLSCGPVGQISQRHLLIEWFNCAAQFSYEREADRQRDRTERRNLLSLLIPFLGVKCDLSPRGCNADGGYFRTERFEENVWTRKKIT